jgi:hypothetical protein
MGQVCRKEGTMREVRGSGVGGFSGQGQMLFLMHAQNRQLMAYAHQDAK